MKMSSGSNVLNRIGGFRMGEAARQIVFVSGSRWAFYWVSDYTARYLNQQPGVRVLSVPNPWKRDLKHKVIYFVSRQKYFGGPYRELDPSNRVFLFWPHGDPFEIESGLKDSFRALPKVAKKYLHRIVVPCEITRRTLIGAGISEEKLCTIPIGVDLGSFRPCSAEEKIAIRRELEIPQNAVCIGSFQKDGVGWDAGFSPKLIKGPDIFLEVAANLRKHFTNLCVLLTGPSRGYLKSGLDKISVPYRHVTLENKNYTKIARCHQSLDLYLVTSRCEGGPMGFLESWAAGIPVVSTRMGMPADLIRHRQNGMLAEVDESERLSQCVREIIEDESLKKKCAAQALEDIKPYDWANVAKMYNAEFLR